MTDFPTTGAACLADEVVVSARSQREALGRLFDAFYPEVLRYARRRLLSLPAAEDVTSDVFLQVARGLPAFRGETIEDFRRWLFRIATNAVNAQLRQSLRRRELLDEAARLGAVPVADFSPVESSDDAIDWGDVFAAIQELSERDQSIITLRYFAGLEATEIGGVLGATAAAVRTALSRALRKLRDRLRLHPVSPTPDDDSSG